MNFVGGGSGVYSALNVGAGGGAPSLPSPSNAASTLMSGSGKKGGGSTVNINFNSGAPPLPT